jgi:murein DD-endopeptidase MepM/ murein hydrolase activator NlpD
LFAANRDRIRNPNLLQVGQVLIVPSAQPISSVPKQAAPQSYAVPVPRAATPRSEYADSHAGYPALDLQVGTGTPVYAIKGGTVSYIGGACGLGVLVIAPDGDRYMYCHLNNRVVAPGTYVGAGTPLGESGSTGNSTGPHLHIEAGDGQVLRCPQPQLLAIYDGRAVPSMASLPMSGCVH